MSVLLCHFLTKSALIFEKKLSILPSRPAPVVRTCCEI